MQPIEVQHPKQSAGLGLHVQPIEVQYPKRSAGLGRHVQPIEVQHPKQRPTCTTYRGSAP